MHHKVDSTIVVHDHRLSHHGATLADGHLFELAFFLLEVRIGITPLLFFLPVGGEGEPDWQLLGRGDAIVDDTVVVLSNKRYVKASHGSHLGRDCPLDAVVAHAL